MGRDKALLEVYGEPMVRRVARALDDAGAARVVAVGGDQVAIAAALDRRAVVADDTPGQGPLGGILTALRVLDAELVLVVACDLVAPSSRAMAATVAALSADPPSDVAAPVHDGEIQWLHAAWRSRSVGERLAACFTAGEHSVHRAVAAARLAVLEVPGLGPTALADADTPADLPHGSGRTRQ